jgi:hypothetical protein
MIQTFLFHLPSNSGLVASVITPAIQKEVADAVILAITLASGQAPSNMTIIPTFSTSSSDGSITISFFIDATLSKIVNTTTFISADTYAADPIGSTAIAVKSATGGIGVQSAAISLTTAARQASVSVCALFNATATSSTTNTLVSRIANVIRINASSIEATGVCTKVDDAIISNVFGIVTTGDGINSDSSSTNLSLTELFQSGGIAGLIAALIASFILYTIARRISNNNKKKKEDISTSPSTTSRSTIIKSMTSPSKQFQQQQPKAPKNHPPKHAFTSFQHTHTENLGSVNSSDNSLRLVATTINPLRAGRSTTTISTKR